MKYILSEEEYNALKSEQELKIKLSEGKLQALCTKIADEMPIKVYWSDEKEPWGCLLTKEKADEEWYCDHCPVQEICPQPGKEWSK